MDDLITNLLNMRVLAFFAFAVAMVDSLYFGNWDRAFHAGIFATMFEGIHRLDLVRATLWEVLFSYLAIQEQEGEEPNEPNHNGEHPIKFTAASHAMGNSPQPSD
jgi:hypothetical protein